MVLVYSLLCLTSDKTDAAAIQALARPRVHVCSREPIDLVHVTSHVTCYRLVKDVI